MLSPSTTFMCLKSWMTNSIILELRYLATNSRIWTATPSHHKPILLEMKNLEEVVVVIGMREDPNAIPFGFLMGSI